MEASKSLKYTGTVVWVGAIQRRKGRNGEFVSREFVISPNPEDKYPTMLKLTLKKGRERDNTSLVTERARGMGCTVEFFPDARFWDDPKTGERKVFADNVAWRVEWDAPAAPEESVAPAAEPDDDDLPF